MKEEINKSAFDNSVIDYSTAYISDSRIIKYSLPS